MIIYMINYERIECLIYWFTYLKWYLQSVLFSKLVVILGNIFMLSSYSLLRECPTCMCCCPGWLSWSVYGGFHSWIFSSFSWLFSFASVFSSAIVWKPRHNKPTVKGIPCRSEPWSRRCCRTKCLCPRNLLPQFSFSGAWESLQWPELWGKSPIEFGLVKNKK